MDLNGEWIRSVLQNWVADLLKWVFLVAGGVVIAWARVNYQRWVDPFLCGLMATVCLYILLYGFHGWLIPGVFTVGSIILLLIMGRRERTTITPAAAAFHTPPLLEMKKWSLPTADDVLQVAERLKIASDKVPVKILAGEDGQAFADLLVRILRLFDWGLQDNPDSATYVFPLPRGDSLLGIRVRCRGQSSSIVVLQCLLLCGVLEELFSCRVESRHLPETDAYNFIQVEIGSPPSSL